MLLKFRCFLSATILVLTFAACTKEYSFENGGTAVSGGTSGGTATFIIGTSQTSCTNDTVNGTYIATYALSNSNTVIISVVVDTIGSYNISTGSADDISFKSYGIFTTTGLQTVTLTGSGTPITAGALNFIPGANGCPFTINVANAP